MNTILPWHDILWQQIIRRWQQDRLPHALLLCGSEGMGKGLFARRLAKTLLCENAKMSNNLSSFENNIPSIDNGLKEISEEACHCKSCNLFRAETHSDFSEIEPAGTKNISIDQIRALIQFCTLTANYGGYQIIILKPAEAMNRNAANGLLKLLEEPPSDTLIMLVSHQPMRLSATIRSRCQRLDFSRPNRAITEAWLHEQLSHSRAYDIKLLLNLSNQAPLKALALAKAEGMTKRQELFDSLAELPSGKNDPIRIAEGWSKEDVLQILQWMHSWTMDIIRYASTAQTQYLINHDYQNKLQRFAEQFDLHRLFKLLDLQNEAYQLVMGNTNVKAQGLLESIAIAWVRLGRRRQR